MSRSNLEAEARAVAAATKADLEELSRMSAEGPGVTRLAYSPEDLKARSWFRNKCQSMGLVTCSDAVGNSFGLPPDYESQRPILIGSHLDSVSSGGMYDGTLGVVLGVNLVQSTLNGEEPIPLALASFACEESTRFGFGSIGSRYFMNELPDHAFVTLINGNGDSLRSVIASTGEPEHRSERCFRGFRGYVEMHIDQGTMLTGLGSRLGVVTGIAGVHRSEFVWTGEEAHSGGRLRADRKDALVSAAEFVVEANEFWREEDEDGTVVSMTIGKLSVEPNSSNTVPGRVTTVLELRSADLGMIDSFLDRLQKIANEIAGRHGIDLHERVLGRVEPVAMSDRLVETFTGAARDLDIQAPLCTSLAGHDALVIGRGFPAGMLLLANPTGISHAVKESVDEEAIEECALVMLSCLPDLVAACS